jgi:hypothetical protein
VFNSSPESHKEHVKITLDILRTNQLFAKRSKCRFGCKKVEYLGHISYADGVPANLGKIKAMGDWSFPTIIKALRDFLGLRRYYRKFIHAYGSIAAPLTSMLKKNAFSWSEEAKEAFLKLKSAVSQAPVLALLDFEKPFLIDCDASGLGVGAVLMQGNRLLPS